MNPMSIGSMANTFSKEEWIPAQVSHPSSGSVLAKKDNKKSVNNHKFTLLGFTLCFVKQLKHAWAFLMPVADTSSGKKGSCLWPTGAICEVAPVKFAKHCIPKSVVQKTDSNCHKTPLSISLRWILNVSSNCSRIICSHMPACRLNMLTAVAQVVVGSCMQQEQSHNDLLRKTDFQGQWDAHTDMPSPFRLF